VFFKQKANKSGRAPEFDKHDPDAKKEAEKFHYSKKESNFAANFRVFSGRGSHREESDKKRERAVWRIRFNYIPLPSEFA
jgi:hypothetical protein